MKVEFLKKAIILVLLIAAGGLVIAFSILSVLSVMETL